MVAIPDTQDNHPAEALEAINALLAEWAARSAASSPALIERFETMGYEVRGKSEDDIVATLRRPPTRAARPPRE